MIDSGDRRKLERFGSHVLDRPEPSANWSKSSPNSWDRSDFFFWEVKGKQGEWKNLSNKPKSWKISYKSKLKEYYFQLELSNYKHIGIFPEQAANWKFIESELNQIENARFLNLFAYTSAASIVASTQAKEVVNVEALKQLNNWSKENAKLNGVDNVKWLIDDAKIYVDRAVRRGEKFNGIILDPPAFGYGSNGKRWILEKDLDSLLSQVMKLIDHKESFLIVNTYSPKMPMESLMELIDKYFPKLNREASFLGIEQNKSNALELGNVVRLSNH